MFAPLLPLVCLGLLALALHLDPGGAPARVGCVAAAAVAFGMARPLLPGGGFERLVMLGTGLTAAACWGLGVAPVVVGARALQGLLTGIFLGLLDLLTLRRTSLRRAYNFVVVLGIMGAGWYLVALWLPGLEAARPPLLASMGAEVACGAALGLTCVLAAPGLGDMVAQAPGTPGIPPPPELCLESGQGRAGAPPPEARDSIPTPSRDHSEEEDHG